MFLDYFSIAFKNLRKRGVRSYLTMLGIFIGIAAVVSLISLGNGLQNAITSQFDTLAADRLLVQNAGTGFGPPGASAIGPLTDHDIEIMESVSGVVKVVPRLLRVARVDYNKVASFEYVASVPDNQEDIDYLYESSSLKIDEGSLLSLSDSGKVLLGSNFKENNRFGKDIRPGTKLEIQGKDFEVIGILEKTSSFQYNDGIFMNQKDMEDIFNVENEYDFALVQVEDKDKINEVSEDLGRKLRRDRHLKEGEEDFSIQTPVQTLSAINTILLVINIVVSGIAAISLLVGGIGIANTMYTSVLERTKEIGTIKAIGAKNKDVMLIFLIESGLLGLVGGILGVLLGYAVSKAIEYIAVEMLATSLLQTSSPPALVIGCIAFAFLIGAVSGLLPAYRASRINTVEAIRYE